MTADIDHGTYVMYRAGCRCDDARSEAYYRLEAAR